MNHRGKLLLILFTAILAVPASACRANDIIKVGEHQFVVPSANLIPDSARPFFLPPSKEEGFIFIINPKDALRDQVLVGVARKDDICRRARETEATVNTTVCADHALKWRGRQLHRTGDDIFWSYVLKAEGSLREAILVNCFKSGGHNHGLCSSVLPLQDLVLTLRMADSKVGELGKLFDQASAQLRAWEH